MEIGEVIREYRKKKNMTQEEVANCLGVTAPAVNKWENGNSQPDIMLLAPIARLLNITLDTLMSFEEKLTAEEINNIVDEMDTKLRNKTYEEVFKWEKRKIEEYPTHRFHENRTGLIKKFFYFFIVSRHKKPA